MEENLLYRIDELTKKVDNLVIKFEAFNEIITNFRISDTTINSRISRLEERLDALEKKREEDKKLIVELKEAPLKKDSDHWKSMVNTILKYVLDASILALLIKIGLK